MPKVTLGTPLMCIAKAVREFIATESSCLLHLAADSANTPSDESSSFIDSNSQSCICTAQDQEEVENNINLPHKDDFPFLNKF